MISRNIDLNFLYLIFGLLILFENFVGIFNNTFLINSELGISIFTIIFIFCVLYEYYFNNLLLKVLNFFFFTFYLLRIFIIPILGSEFQTIIFDRNVDIFLINDAILNLSIHYLILFISIVIINPKFNFKIKKNYLFKKKLLERKIIIILILFYLANIIISILLLNKYQLSLFWVLFNNIFALDRVFILLLFFCLYFNKSNFNIISLIIITIIHILFFTYTGSKIGLFFVLLIYFFYLSTQNKIQINIKNFFYVFLSSLIGLFFWNISHIFRNMLYMNIHFNDLSHKSFFEINFYNILDIFFYRIGYLDFYLEKSLNIIYNDIISFEYHIKAFLDKITPGFDIYGIPLTKNVIHDYYHFNSYNKISDSNSEQITLFADSSLIFNDYYFIYYFFSIAILKLALFISNKFFKSYENFMVNTFLLYLFYTWLTGFGLDLFLMNVIHYSFFLFIIFSLIRIISLIKVYEKN